MSLSAIRCARWARRDAEGEALNSFEPSPFEAMFRNPHLATIAANFWPRPKSERQWPVEEVVYQTEPAVRVLIHSQRPNHKPKGELVLIHGLEGSSAAGYARSMVHA